MIVLDLTQKIRSQTKVFPNTINHTLQWAKFDIVVAVQLYDEYEVYEIVFSLVNFVLFLFYLSLQLGYY